MQGAEGNPSLDREALWERLRDVVLDKRRSAPNRHFLPILRDLPTAEDFIGEYLLDCVARDEAGTLLAAFDSSRGHAIDYLTARHVLRQRAVHFAARMRREFVGLDDVETIAPEGAPRPAPDVNRAFAGIRLVWPEDRPTAPRLMAAVQLWPRLEPDDARHPRIRDSVGHRIGGPRPIERLEHEHEIAAASLRVARSPDDERSSDDLTPRQRRRREARRLATLWRMVFQPLERAALGRLLAMRPDQAHKQLQRYREALPSLIEGLRELAHQIGMAPDPEESEALDG